MTEANGYTAARRSSSALSASYWLDIFGQYVVPAPGVNAALAAAGLLGARRRRV